MMLQDLARLITLFTGTLEDVFGADLPGDGEPGRFFNYHFFAIQWTK